MYSGKKVTKAKQQEVQEPHVYGPEFALTSDTLMVCPDNSW